MPQQSSQPSPLSTVIQQVLDCLACQNGQQVLELGCGQADTIRQLAGFYPQVRFLASDVDRQAIQWNRQHAGPANLHFRLGAAQQIDLPDRSVNAVMMIKSLHHVPVADMAQSLREVARVLVPGGRACLIEPVYAGAFNEILRLFHDEKSARQHAWSAICAAARGADFQRVKQVFFEVPRHFQDFADYEKQVMQVTHRDFHVDADLRRAVQLRFMEYADADGSVTFHTPHRLDCLRRLEPPASLESATSKPTI